MSQDAKVVEARRLAQEAKKLAEQNIENGKPITAPPVRDAITKLGDAIERLADHMQVDSREN